MDVWRVVGAIGRLLLALGILLLLFVAYLLWGTGISESSHQSALKAEFKSALNEHRHAQGISSGSTPTTSVPSSLVRELVSGNAPGEGQPIAVIDIAKIGVDKVVVQGTSTDDLHFGPGHYVGTPLPGQSGNVAIAGHRTTYGAPFYNLNQLSPGDFVVLTTLQGTFTYSVVRSLIVAPSDTSVLSPSSAPTLTLTTCNPRFSASQRLVVQADLTGTPAPIPSPPSSSSTSRASGSGALAGTQGPWAGAVAWGVGTAAFGVVGWSVIRRRRRTVRWLAYGVGVVPLLVLLYFFFENVSPLLPASF